MSNKQNLQTHNTDLSKILSEIGDLPIKALVEAAAKNGKYVWKKVQKSQVSPQFKLRIDTTKTATVLDENFDVSSIDDYKDFFDGFYFNSVVKFEHSTSSMTNYALVLYTSSTGTVTATFDKNSKTFSFSGTVAGALAVGTTNLFKKDGTIDVIGEESYVVSDSETAYPDGAMQDGYWYERITEGVDILSMFGYTKIAIDKFMVSSDSLAGKVPVSHSLGEIPKFAMMWAKNGISGSAYPEYSFGWDLRTGNGTSIGVNWYLKNGSSIYCEARNTSGTDADKVYLNGGNFKAGVEYTLITMA